VLQSRGFLFFEVVPVLREINSPAKINLTLRITGSMQGGYHSIGTLFFRLPAAERLTLNILGRDNVSNDIIRVHGFSIKGKNILEEVLETARRKNPAQPVFEIDLWKKFPPGSGVGSGSGNAAALARFMTDEGFVEFSEEEILSFGADVPFLFGGERAGYRRGVGDIPFPLQGLENYSPRILSVIPDWSQNTAEAYRMADDFYRSSGWPMNDKDAWEEAIYISRALSKNEMIGLLPNDFFQVISARHPEYQDFAQIADSSGSYAWGLGGSGSSFFCLFREGTEMKKAVSLFKRHGATGHIFDLG
jgi:4-diphosphocytidyl-2-C-methyl-D-erythritol kinase